MLGASELLGAGHQLGLRSAWPALGLPHNATATAEGGLWEVMAAGDSSSDVDGGMLEQDLAWPAPCRCCLN